MNGARLRLGVLATHPVQYYAPWYRALDALCDLEVFFSDVPSAEAQAAAGFGVAFEWDVPLLDGYRSRRLTNTAATPDVNTFWGCRTPEIAGIIESRRFDAFVVHGWSTASYWQAIRACWRSRTPVLVRGDSQLSTPRGLVRRMIKWPLYRWFIPRFDGYLVVGAKARAYLEHYGADPGRCFPAPHGVDNHRFASAVEGLRAGREALRARWGLPPDGVVFLFAGKLIPLKRADLFVEAVERAARAHPGVCGLVVGDGPRRADLEALVQRRGLPITFAGFLNQSEIAAAYAAADVLVLPSDHETWGLVVNEGMAAGLPAIVSTAAGCAPDLIVEGVTGATFHVGSAEALGAEMTRMAADPAARARMGAAAVRHIEAFSPGAAAEGTLLAVRAVRGERGASRNAGVPAAVRH